MNELARLGHRLQPGKNPVQQRQLDETFRVDVAKAPARHSATPGR